VNMKSKMAASSTLSISRKDLSKRTTGPINVAFEWPSRPCQLQRLSMAISSGGAKSSVCRRCAGVMAPLPHPKMTAAPQPPRRRAGCEPAKRASCAVVTELMAPAAPLAAPFPTTAVECRAGMEDPKVAEGGVPRPYRITNVTFRRARPQRARLPGVRRVPPPASGTTLRKQPPPPPAWFHAPYGTA
jgi:hypothetical protein